MPLQNRVLPTGDIVADGWRGLMMGNRGCLHGQGRELGSARWRSKLWICCVLEWRGWQRDPMPPGRWTALFFVDEVSALAAGHRPCAYCRRGDYLDFAHAWQAATAAQRRPWAKEMDDVLHVERLEGHPRRKRTYRALTADLPDGVLVRDGGAVAMVAAGRLLPWSSTGYGRPKKAPAGEVDVLTPPSIVASIAAGYRPSCHPSATVGSADLRVHGQPVG